ncbi:MAG: transcriptional regulator [Chloroflexota bacterium]|nr:transcriptional regulator [Dehalococcoidia bacterium]MDW8254003.1 transcriptional regulator [Chloroflexota bacterium]
MNAAELIQSIRSDLAAVERRLTAHPFLERVEQGALPQEQLRPLAGEQFHIISADLRSVAHLVSRFGGGSARDFFLDVLAGERTALAKLLTFAEALGMSAHDLARYEPLPAAHAYTAYMAYLALYASDAEVAAAYLVNFPAWGNCCGRIARALRAHYGLSEEETGFFDFFATPNPGFEPAALAIIQAKLDAGWPVFLIRRAARLLQGYELMFWDAMEEATR